MPVQHACLQNLIDISIDEASETAVIGAGQRLGAVYATLAQKGFLLPGRHYSR